MKKSVFLIAVLALFVIPLASAQILFTQPDSSYNLGESFNITVTLNPSTDTSGFFTSSLICGNGEVELYKSPASLSAKSSKNFLIEGRFDRFLTGNLSGRCFFKASYGGEQSSTKVFDLTNEVKVAFTLSEFIFNPEDTIEIDGSASKLKGSGLNGFVEVSIEEINSTSKGEVSNGEFNISLVIPSNAPAGKYNLAVKTYDIDSNEDVMNEGTKVESITINQVVRDIGVAINEQNIVPKNDLVYTILVFDQSGKNVDKEAKVAIYSPSGEIFENKTLASGAATNFKIESNYAPGYWNIKARVENLESERAFFVEDFPLIEFKLEGNNLIVTNTGNVRYVKPLDILIGNITQTVNLDLEVGKTKRFKLSAPEGEYDIGVKDGDEVSTIGRAALTGNAVSLSDAGNINFGAFTFIFWILLIIILIAIALFVYRKIRKKNFVGRTPSAGGKFTNAGETNKSGISHGHKQESYIVAVNLRTKKNLGAVDSALAKAKESKAKIYMSDNFRVLIFAPALTGDNENGMRALLAAQDIRDSLKKHGIDFGIGCHVGDLIVEDRSGGFKFTSLGNAIGRAKNLSENSKEEILLTKEMHGKMVGKIKSEKHPTENFWRVKRVSDRAQYDEFVSKFKEKHGHG